MPQRAQRSLIFVSIVVFLAGACVVLAGMGGQTHVWRGGLLVGIFLSSHTNGLTDIAIGAYLYRYHRAVRGRGENTRLWWTLSSLFILGGAAQLLGGGTPFLPRPVAVALMIAAIAVRLARAGFAVWNFPNMRRDLKAEGKRATRTELQTEIERLKAELEKAHGHVEEAHTGTNNDAITNATSSIITALSTIDAIELQLGRLNLHEGYANGR